MMPVIPLTVRYRAILEIVKFPKSSRAENRHDRPLNFVPDRSAGDPGRRRRGAPARAPAPQVLAAKKLNLRKLLLTGAAIAALAGAAGMAGTTGPSASIWCRPTTPM
jgi:hypothetical protein